MRKRVLFAVTMIILSYASCKHCDKLPSPTCPTDSTGAQINAFSPNGDGLNDVYRILPDSSHPFTSMELHIFNADEVEVAVIFGAHGAWDGKDSRTGKLCPPGLYRVEFGTTASGYGTHEIAVDGEGYITLFGASGLGCLVGQGCPDSLYDFEDQFDKATRTVARATRESFCK